MDYYIKEYIDYNEQEVLSLYKSVGWANYIQNPEMLKAAYNHSLKIYGAYSGEELIGIIRVVGDGFSVVFIQDLLVFPEYQRQGIGEMMMKYAEDLAIKSGCLQMSLEVRISNNKAISLYEKRLFKKVAIRNNYYEDNHEDAYLMIKELEV